LLIEKHLILAFRLRDGFSISNQQSAINNSHPPNISCGNSFILIEE